SGVYEASSRYAGSTRASGNVCVNGSEKDGALITAKQYDFGFAKGLMMFLGGSSKSASLKSSTYPTPPNMPNN
ncbi:MAG: hypothetical protein ABJA02_14935, partial [Acidobacteriota bacterium]